MEKLYHMLQFGLSGVIAWVSAKLGMLYPVLCILFVLMVVDYISGMMASKAEAVDHPGDPAYGWNSRKGAKGILKKVAYVCVITVAMVLDYIILYVSAQIGIAVNTKAFFGLLVAVWYILNEMLSIVENAGRMGAAIPEWLLKYIAVLKDKIDDEGSGGE